MTERVLVTGAHGVVGVAVVKALRAAGAQVVCLDRRCALDPVALEDRAAVRARTEGVSAVVHLAAVSSVGVAEQNPASAISVNVDGTRNLVEAIESKARLIFASSREVYAQCDGRPTREDDPLGPRNAYGWTKLAGEATVLSRTESMVFRLGNVYGSLAERPERIFGAVHRSLTGGPPVTINGPNVVLDFVHLDGTTSGNEVFHLQRVNGTSLDPVVHFTPEVGHSSSTSIGSEWRNTLEQSGQARGDLLLAYSSRTKNSNLMLTTATTSTRVTAIKAPLGVGTQICVSLPHSNVDCDTVDDIGFTKTVQGKSVIDLAATRGGYEGEGGDSGGPVYIQGSPHIWAGSHHGSKVDNLGRTFQLFSMAHLIDDGNLGIHSFRMDPTNGREDFLQNLYMRLLNRTPDYAGFTYWYGQMSSCNATSASGVAESFLQASEFKNRFPMTGSTANKRSNAGMRLWYAYRTFFGRDPDSGGMAFWLDSILAPSGYSEGTWDWVTTAFGDATEFSNRVNGIGVMPVDGWICV